MPRRYACKKAEMMKSSENPTLLLHDPLLFGDLATTTWCFLPSAFTCREETKKQEKQRKYKKKRRRRRKMHVCVRTWITVHNSAAVSYGSKRAVYVLFRRRHFIFRLRVWVSRYGLMISPTMGRVFLFGECSCLVK